MEYVPWTMQSECPNPPKPAPAYTHPKSTSPIHRPQPSNSIQKHPTSKEDTNTHHI
ncbi:hypothetical protein M422DRAFT_23604 [Sphaerobolus stellatus SS14]|nr:hypothetical protein M422DRAFT_23604 [Sphaerobolus stellatus SS14]